MSVVGNTANGEVIVLLEEVEVVIDEMLMVVDEVAVVDETVDDAEEVVVVMVASEMTETVLPPKENPELATKTSPLEAS
jgi:hypothetical protein